MKALVYYCRWQGAALRLRGRSDTAVWGHLVLSLKDGREELQEFHFDLRTSELTVHQDGGKRSLLLDEKGVPLTPP
ncbi:MAG: hypothetical protein GWP61_01715 [Chloroflexi bacterium]|jgi:hypothetical protein|nr:hypothetical protein [Chloroflexota bacterium]